MRAGPAKLSKIEAGLRGEPAGQGRCEDAAMAIRLALNATPLTLSLSPWERERRCYGCARPSSPIRIRLWMRMLLSGGLGLASLRR